MPDEVASYSSRVVDRLEAEVSADVVGAYLIGSVALGGYRPGSSDVDLLVVLDAAPSPRERQRVVDAVSHPTLPCPTRGLELQVYDAASVARPRRDGAFLVNLNTGPGMTTSVSFDPSSEPAHWFVVDRAIASGHGVVVRGPAPATVIAATPRALVLDALRASARWHAVGDPLGANSVLNACRALRFVADDTFVSKDDAATWAIDHDVEPALVRAAESTRRDEAPSALPADAVHALLERVAAAVDDARSTGA